MGSIALAAALSLGVVPPCPDHFLSAKAADEEAFLSPLERRKLQAQRRKELLSKTREQAVKSAASVDSDTPGTTAPNPATVTSNYSTELSKSFKKMDTTKIYENAAKKAPSLEIAKPTPPVSDSLPFSGFLSKSEDSRTSDGASNFALPSLPSFSAPEKMPPSSASNPSEEAKNAPPSLSLPKIDVPSLPSFSMPKIEAPSLPSFSMPKDMPTFNPPSFTLPKDFPKLEAPAVPSFKLPGVPPPPSGSENNSPPQVQVPVPSEPIPDPSPAFVVVPEPAAAPLPPVEKVAQPTTSSTANASQGDAFEQWNQKQNEVKKPSEASKSSGERKKRSKSSRRGFMPVWLAEMFVLGIFGALGYATVFLSDQMWRLKKAANEALLNIGRK